MSRKRLANVRLSKSQLQDKGEVWLLTLNPIFVVSEIPKDNLNKPDVLSYTEDMMHDALVKYMGELINDFYREGAPIRDGEPITIRTIPRDTIVSDVRGFRPP